MAIYKKIAAAGKYQDNDAIYDVVSYITRKDKTPSDIIGGIKVDDNNIAGSMVEVSESFNKYSRVRLHHFVVSFCPYEIYSLGVLICMAEEICRHIGQEFQVVHAFHEDTHYPHLHFVFNAVSYVDGHRYRGGKEDYHRQVCTIGKILRSYGVAELKPVDYYPNPNCPHE